MSLPCLDAMLLYLDPQTRERVVRAAEDSIRAELRRVNELLTEAIRDRVAAERALDDAHVRNMIEQDEHSAERAKLAKERDEARRGEAIATDLAARERRMANEYLAQLSDAGLLRPDAALDTASREGEETQRPPPPCSGCGIDRDGGPCSLCAAAMIGVGR